MSIVRKSFVKYRPYGTWDYGESMCRYTYIYSVSTSVKVYGIMVSQCVGTLTFTMYLQVLRYMVLW
jgi:hypothetical protein